MGLARLDLSQALERSSTFLRELNLQSSRSSAVVDRRVEVKISEVGIENTMNQGGTFDTRGLQAVDWNELVGQKSNPNALLVSCFQTFHHQKRRSRRQGKQI